MYAYQQNAMTSRVLESVSINGSSRATLYNEATGQRFNDPHLSPNGQWVVYDTYPSLQISAIPAAGGASIPLGLGEFPQIMPDSSRVIFNQDSFPFDLYSIPVSGGEARNFSLGQFLSPESLALFAGLFTAAFSLGARPLIADMLAGMNFIFEDNFDVGEKIEVASYQ